MRWLALSELFGALGDLDPRYRVEVSNNPGVWAFRSPHTGLLVLFPMGHGDRLAESLVRHILADEPIDVDALIRDVEGRGGAFDQSVS